MRIRKNSEFVSKTPGHHRFLVKTRMTFC